MNANDNFEKKDLNDSNVTPISDAAAANAQEQNNEAKEEIKKEQDTTPESSEMPNVEKTEETEAETKPEDKPVAETEGTTTTEVEPKEENTDAKSEDETVDPVDAKDVKTEEAPEADSKEKEEPTTEAKEEPAEKSEEKKEETTDTVKKDKPIAPLTFDEIVSRLRELASKDKFSRKELDKLQSLYFSEIRKETDEQKYQFLTDGGKEEDFVIKESTLHTEGKNLLQTLAETRKKMVANEEKQKETNYERKVAIIEEVGALSESQEDFNKKYQDFKTLQREWNSIKHVPHGKEHELWKLYQEQVEKFYDIVHLHNEYRDYDFKKNLESKIELCESAEKLNEEDDLVSAFHQLQKLHKDWRDIGPVARKDRELIWQRFKQASAEINRKYQERIESLKAQESENYEKKITICEKLEAIDISALKDSRDWEVKTREVLDLQNEWRQVGYAPRKVNAKIFQRYRTACDLFFKGKNAFYLTIRGELDENMAKKTELCERAEAMKESQDWKETTSSMIAIQREWKEIGMVPRKYSSAIWKRFISACDYFFEQKKLNTKSIRQEEAENLELKKGVTEKIKNLDTTLAADEAVEKLKELMDEWYAIGFVPFKDKNAAQKMFTDATDAQYSRLNIDRSERKLDSFKSNITEMTKSDRSRGQVLHEREKLMRQFERMKSELQTYENNIGFLTSSSKKGNVLLDDMNSKIEKIKAELELIVKKIDTIDENI